MEVNLGWNPIHFDCLGVLLPAAGNQSSAISLEVIELEVALEGLDFKLCSLLYAEWLVYSDQGPKFRLVVSNIKISFLEGYGRMQPRNADVGDSDVA